MDNLKVLVVSDLHAIVDQTDNDDSRLVIKEGRSEFGDVLLSYINELQQPFDLMVCAGDIANKASKDSFSAGWNFLRTIRKDLNIETLLCVPGNHDHISRVAEECFDPKHFLQFHDPRFPLEDEYCCTHFWAWHWCHVKLPYANAILINSSAYHGYGDEHKHGRISIEVSEQISNFLNSRSFEKKSLNILVCHHHPIKMDQVDNDFDTEAMEGGSSLMNSINESNKGPWLIIHGHKHFPELTYGPSKSTEQPTILSAGSLSAKLYPHLADKTSNQFYILNIDLKKSEQSGRVVGRFETHEWTVRSGWKHSEKKNLPGRGGFGSTTTPTLMATKIIDLLVERNTPFLDEIDLSTVQNELDYFPPPDISKLKSQLTERGFEAIFEGDRIIQVGKV